MEFKDFQTLETPPIVLNGDSNFAILNRISCIGCSPSIALENILEFQKKKRVKEILANQTERLFKLSFIQDESQNGIVSFIF